MRLAKAPEPSDNQKDVLRGHRRGVATDELGWRSRGHGDPLSRMLTVVQSRSARNMSWVAISTVLPLREFGNGRSSGAKLMCLREAFRPTGSPQISTSPEYGRINPARMWRPVVFPEPLGPRSP